MNAIAERPTPTSQVAHVSDPQVERTDISFQDVAGGKVRICVTVRNTSSVPSRATRLNFAAAPFGAFVPWGFLTMLPVPALNPGQSHLLSTEVERPHPKPLGDFNRVPPKRLLTALNTDDQPTPRGAAQRKVAILAFLAALLSGRESEAGSGPALPPDLLELVGRANPYWAGNINVFIGARPVERHKATALRVYPGRTNLAMFIVGDMARAEAFAFELLGLEEGWEGGLYDVTNNETLVVGPSDVPLREKRWVEAGGTLVVMLAIRPPEGCGSGDVEVRVTRRSEGTSAIVEFNLDPNAQGAGCYAA